MKTMQRFQKEVRLALRTINQRHHSTADIETQSSELGESREGLVA